MSDSDQYLRAIADAAARDIKADFPHSNTMYDLYVEDLTVRVWGKTRIYTVGLIDMGESFQAVYVWLNERWELVDLDPFEIREMIINERTKA